MGSDEPKGDARAEHSRCLVRVEARPIAWIDHETGDVSIHSTATPAEIREALTRSVRRTCDAEAMLGRSESPRVRREHALESDPYAFNGYSFADFVDADREVLRGAASSGTPDIVRRRIADDVERAHRMLDNIGTPSGTLSTRIGLALLGVPTVISPPKFSGVPTNIGDTLDAIMRRTSERRHVRTGPNVDDPIRTDPLADADAVGIPEPDAVFAVLSNLTGEEVFKVFDRCGVLPTDPDTVKGWVLTDEAHVGIMVHDCLEIALTRGRLSDVYNAARESVARKRGTA